MQCTHEREDGIRCGARAMRDALLCFSHNPATQERKALAVKKGGLSTKVARAAIPLEKVRLESIADVLSIAEDTINRIRCEPMTVKQATAIGYLLAIAFKVIPELQHRDDRRQGLRESSIFDSNGMVTILKQTPCNLKLGASDEVTLSEQVTAYGVGGGLSRNELLIRSFGIPKGS